MDTIRTDKVSIMVNGNRLYEWVKDKDFFFSKYENFSIVGIF